PTPIDISTLSLPDALPISHRREEVLRQHRGLAHRVLRVGDAEAAGALAGQVRNRGVVARGPGALDDAVLVLDAQVRADRHAASRSEEHTSELQSRFDLVCR